MATTFMLLVVLVFTTLTVDINYAQKTPPTFARSYSVSGVLNMPNAGVREPFDCYYDLVRLRSRIDYYNGMTKTYQKFNKNFGTSYKVAHVTTESFFNKEECFSVQGSIYNIILPQTLIPDASKFSLIEENVTCGHTLCDKWGLTVFPSKDVTTRAVFLVTLDGEPFQYAIDGSDNYEYNYFNYTPGPQNDSLFEIVLECHPMYDPIAEDFHDHNPMKSLIDNNDTHVDNMFEDFKSNHGKQYENDLMEQARKLIFKQNVRYIHSTNRAGNPFKLAINQFADLTSEELMKKKGRLHTKKEHTGGILFSREKHLGDAAIPDSFDWRTKGAVTPVKDQATCGSCWSFGTTGTLEGAIFRKTGKLVSLSEQSLVDCSWGFGNYGCDGGLDHNSYEWIMKHGGIPTSESYGPYLSEDGLCHMDMDNVTKMATIQEYVRVPQNDIDSLKYAIAYYGPVSVSIDATTNFQFYSSGVLYDYTCGNKIYELNHNVLAVGYGVESGENYWLIKNSWSKFWGDEGYIKLSRKDNNCGVATAATFVFLSGEVEPSTVFPPHHGGTASSVHISHWFLAILSMITSVFIYTDVIVDH